MKSPALALVLLAVAASAHGQGAWKTPQNGYDLVAQLRHDDRFFPTRDGLIEIANYAAAMGFIQGIAHAHKPICYPQGGANSDQIQAAVLAFLEQNEPRLGEDADVLVIEALESAYRCGQR
jgi:hypothetical protein